MIHRKILYGYQIKNGELNIVPTEAETVKMIFTYYIAGASYMQISDKLNSDNIPFSTESPAWNKNKIKRMLENPRYTGNDGYPTIIDKETFRMVQGVIQSKITSRVKAERPALKIKPYLRCQTCGNGLRRLAGKNRKEDTLYLKCDKCDALITITDAELMDKITKQMMKQNAPAEIKYTPTDKVVHLANAINRSLEQPDDPEEVISLILQGISARYDCWEQDPASNQKDSRPAEVDIKRFGEAVSYITITSDKQVKVYFKEQVT